MGTAATEFHEQHVACCVGYRHEVSEVWSRRDENTQAAYDAEMVEITEVSCRRREKSACTASSRGTAVIEIQPSTQDPVM